MKLLEGTFELALNNKTKGICLWTRENVLFFHWKGKL